MTIVSALRYTMEVFFCGIGLNRTYLDYKVGTFDEFARGSFSCAIIDGILNELGYFASDPKIRVYWCKPGHSIVDGLVAIRYERDAVLMEKCAKEEKTLMMYVDHVSLLEKQKWAEVHKPTMQLPAVISPSKPAYKQRAEEDHREFQSAADDVVGQEGEESSDGSVMSCRSANSSDADSDFIDSDYDFAEDDEQFKQNVDEGVKDDILEKTRSNVQRQPDKDVVQEDELELPEEQKSEVTYKWKMFNKSVDVQNPILKLGMVFSNVQEVRKAITMYCVRNRVQVKKKRNNCIRFEGVCKPDCPWLFIATKDSRTGCFVLSKFVDEHTCEREWEVKELTAPLIAEEFLEEVRDNENITMKSFAKKVQKKCNMLPNRFKLARAKLAALKKIRGDEIAQYDHLWDYGEELRTQNPRSKFILKTIDPIFSSLYMCIDACKRGWLKRCRPLICLDGTHIKTKFGGQLLTAIGIDGNDCIYPIAWAIVEVECYSSWVWFLTTLKTDLNIINTSPFTIMSDKQKVIFCD